MLKCKHALINYSWIIQKRRERSRKSRNALKQFYYVTLSKDKMSFLQHFVTLNSSQSSLKEGLTREMFFNTRREISCLCVDLLQVDLLASGASLVNPAKDFFESLVSARPRNMLYLFLA